MNIADKELGIKHDKKHLNTDVGHLMVGSRHVIWSTNRGIAFFTSVRSIWPFLEHELFQNVKVNQENITNYLGLCDTFLNTS